MAPREVECEKCQSEATVKRVEGEMRLGETANKPRIILIIDCPNCGEREQQECPHSLPSK